MAYFRCMGKIGSNGVTITVSYSEDFYNKTITCSHGTKSYSKTATSSGTLDFTVDEEGVWTISSIVDGQIYFVNVDVDLSLETELKVTPDGATVLPTDDIQTWLKCADLVSDCTTLAEVLENEDLFDVLLRDSNACKYMARSTTWAVVEGQVPVMTSDTTPSGTVIASAEAASSAYNKWKAFNPSELKGWLNDETSPLIHAGNYVGYTFTNTIKLLACNVLLKYYSQSCTIKGKIQASNNGTDWTDLTEELTIISNSSDIPEYAIFTKNIGNYTSYRFYCTVAPTSSYSYGIKLQFFEDAGITQIEDAMRRVGKYSYCKNQLMGNEDWTEAIANSPYWEDVLDGLVPVMTSNTTPSGVASASSELPSQNCYAWNAFDNTNNSSWAASSSSLPQWIQYKFTSPKVISKVSMISAATNYRVKQFKIQGSNDGTNFTDISDTLTYADEQTLQSFTLNNIVSYEYIRLVVLSLYGTNLQVAEIRTLQFYGVEEPSINIIHSAPNDTIYYKNGNEPVTLCTTNENGIGEVDFSTLPRGNVTLYSSVAKDPENLTEDYPKNIILTNTIKGGTTEAYMMPDPIRTLYWNGYEDDELEDITTANGWSDGGVGLTLSTPTHNTNYIAISRVSYTDKFVGAKKSISAVKDSTKLHNVMSLSASSTSGNSALAGNTAKIVAGTRTKVFDNAVSAKALNSIVHNVNPAILTARAYPYTEIDAGATSNLYAFWYTKHKLANLRSAACDMVYYYDTNNVQHILAITDEYGFAQVDFTALPAGTYTFYSSVAKDPTNLSNAFSKTVTIDPKQTTELVLMPSTKDKMLYWYGYELDGGFILKDPALTGMTYKELDLEKYTNYFHTAIINSAQGYRGGSYVTAKTVDIGTATSYKILIKRAWNSHYSNACTSQDCMFNNGTGSSLEDRHLCFAEPIDNPTLVSIPISNYSGYVGSDVTKGQFGIYQQMPGSNYWAQIDIQGLWLE